MTGQTEPGIPEASIQPGPAPADDAPSRARRIAALLDDQKAEDIVILDLRGVADFADFFVIATARSTSHMRAAAHRLAEALRADRVRPFTPIEDESPNWTVMDYGDVIVHLFEPATREVYRLEDLWADAKPTEWEGCATA